MLLVTGFAEAATPSRMREVGIRYKIDKSFNGPDLLTGVRNALDGEGKN